eukprot:4577733-Prymnesium_polylepis.1
MAIFIRLLGLITVYRTFTLISVKHSYHNHAELCSNAHSDPHFPHTVNAFTAVSLPRGACACARAPVPHTRMHARAQKARARAPRGGRA